MVLGVARIGVDLGRGLEFESGGFGERHHRRLAHIARRRLVIGRDVWIGAVLDDAENPARLQRRVEFPEALLGGSAHHPVVDVAEGEDHVGRSIRGDRRLAFEGGQMNRSV